LEKEILVGIIIINPFIFPKIIEDKCDNYI